MNTNKNQTVRPMTPGQMKDLIAAVTEGIPSNLSFAVAEKLIGKKKSITAEVKKLFLAKNESGQHLAVIAEWQAFYKKLFGKDYDLSNVIIPEMPNTGRWRLLIVVDLTLEQLYVKCKEQFKCWRWTDDDLDKKVTWNQRDAKNGAYAIWVKDAQEADENLKNLSADDIKEKGMTTETLAERLVHEIKFFQETGNHLDIQKVTLCAGSRYSDGFIPRVHWYFGGMSVHWFDAGFANDGLRSREVVS